MRHKIGMANKSYKNSVSRNEQHTENCSDQKHKITSAAEASSSVLHQQHLQLKQLQSTQPQSTVNPTAIYTGAYAPGSVMARVMYQLHKVADSDISIVVQGESGVGKEVFARLLHAGSARSNQAFIAVNCAAIPGNILESILFGHEKGAFTGALQSHVGKFEQANGGTLLLDEISEMPLDLQAKLLRVLQENEVERLGGRNPISLDVRIVVSTNRNLAVQVAAGTFREDLYYRLNGFTLSLPALRERPADIVPLARYFLAKFQKADAAPLRLSAAAQQTLLVHPWPGNIRELQQAIRRACIFCAGNQVEPEDFFLEQMLSVQPTHKQKEVGQHVCPDFYSHSHDDTDSEIEAQTVSSEPAMILKKNENLEQCLRQLEQGIIFDVAKTYAGERKKMAERLGISDRSLRYKLAEMREAGYTLP